MDVEADQKAADQKAADQKAAGEAEVQTVEGEEKVWRIIIISVTLQ